MMNGAQEKWEVYIVNTGEDIEEWDTGVIGEWTWAEIVAWADNNDEYFTSKEALRDWALRIKDDQITEDMIIWAYQYAEENDLPTDWSIY